jgi:hypothetical protein
MNIKDIRKIYLSNDFSFIIVFKNGKKLLSNKKNFTKEEKDFIKSFKYDGYHGFLNDEKSKNYSSLKLKSRIKLLNFFNHSILATNSSINSSINSTDWATIGCGNSIFSFSYVKGYINSIINGK